MAYIIYTTRTEAEAVQTRVDNALGWPRIGEGICQRVHIGGGRHVTHPACCTTHHFGIIKHPARNEWAIHIDDTARVVSQTRPEDERSLPADWSTLGM